MKDNYQQVYTLNLKDNYSFPFPINTQGIESIHREMTPWSPIRYRDDAENTGIIQGTPELYREYKDDARIYI